MIIVKNLKMKKMKIKDYNKLINRKIISLINKYNKKIVNKMMVM